MRRPANTASKRREDRSSRWSRNCFFEKEGCKIDPVSDFRTKIEELLIVASWSEDLQREAGLERASQVWSGLPAWYLWVSEAPGAYRLELVQADDRNTAEGGSWALFSIKLYPYRQHPIFGRFSPREQALIQSSFFDHTRTPTFEAQDQIAPDLFTVAGLTVDVDRGGRISRFCFESMEPLRTVDSGLGPPPEGIVREFSGIEAGYPLFDTLLCLHSFAVRRPPCRVRVVDMPGFEFHLNGGDVCCRPSESVAGCRVSVWYPGTEDAKAIGGPAPAGDPALPETELPLFDGAGIRPSSPDSRGRPRTGIRINETWWDIAAACHRSHLASSCGCSLESHGE